MRVLVSGAGGLIGSALVRRLQGDGHQVVRLVRRPPSTGEVQWDPGRGRLDAADLQDIEGVVHLAGAGIAERRWSAAQKAKILDSRVEGTGLLSATVAALTPAPTVMVSASAVGYYGDRGDHAITEDSQPGQGYLAGVCRVWEGATAAASDAGVRVVHARVGIVLAPGGGALGKLLPLFKFGVGGRLGSGRQYWSWISLDDAVGALAFALSCSDLTGPVNLTSPNPVTNADFTRALGAAVHRPAILPVPRLALAAAVGGQMAEEMLLTGAKVLPSRLTAAGYTFAHPDLADALRVAVQ
jgi:uncharacterized protein (TIGR01777 family)